MDCIYCKTVEKNFVQRFLARMHCRSKYSFQSPKYGRQVTKFDKKWLWVWDFRRLRHESKNKCKLGSWKYSEKTVPEVLLQHDEEEILLEDVKNVIFVWEMCASAGISIRNLDTRSAQSKRLIFDVPNIKRIKNYFICYMLKKLINMAKFIRRSNHTEWLQW